MTYSINGYGSNYLSSYPKQVWYDRKVSCIVQLKLTYIELWICVEREKRTRRRELPRLPKQSVRRKRTVSQKNWNDSVPGMQP